MKTLFFRCCFTCLIAFIVLIVAPQTAAQKKPLFGNDRVKIHEQSGAAIQSTSSDNLKVVLLGTGVGPPVNLQQFGASTLIEAGGVRLEVTQC
jgi:ribonuclease Z